MVGPTLLGTWNPVRTLMRKSDISLMNVIVIFLCVSLFFAITGCKFQPASESLYTRLSTEDAEGEEYGLNDYNQVESGSTTSLALREAFSGDCDQDL